MKAALPLPPGTSLSWMPPSSLYCCHRSLSRISTAARNLRMATSPCVRLAFLSSAKDGNDNPFDNSPVPKSLAPPTTSPLLKKERRLVVSFDDCALCSMIFSFCACCALCSMIFSRSWLSPSRGTRAHACVLREQWIYIICRAPPQSTDVLLIDSQKVTDAGTVPSLFRVQLWPHY